MKILVDRLTPTPSEFAFEGDSAWWGRNLHPEAGLPRKLEEPLWAVVHAHRVNDDIFLEGEVTGALEVECSRCLARYRHALQEPFRLVLEPAGDRRPSDPEGAVALDREGIYLSDELEAGWYGGNELQLDSLLRDAVALGLPVKPLCEPDCAGLCPRCGADLGRSACDCPEERVDSPFAALAALRGEKIGR